MRTDASATFALRRSCRQGATPVPPASRLKTRPLGINTCSSAGTRSVTLGGLTATRSPDVTLASCADMRPRV
eukprot:1554771-Prymnesium_polylepis.1